MGRWFLPLAVTVCAFGMFERYRFYRKLRQPGLKWFRWAVVFFVGWAIYVWGSALFG
jgi:hypothetical protein